MLDKLKTSYDRWNHRAADPADSAVLPWYITAAVIALSAFFLTMAIIFHNLSKPTPPTRAVIEDVNHDRH